MNRYFSLLRAFNRLSEGLLSVVRSPYAEVGLGGRVAVSAVPNVDHQIRRYTTTTTSIFMMKCL